MCRLTKKKQRIKFASGIIAPCLDDGTIAVKGQSGSVTMCTNARFVVN